MKPALKKGKVKLERALSKLGLASRTEARALIERGEVEVNGRIIVDPNRLVTPETARIRISGQEARAPELFAIMLHKPRGVVTTSSDEKGRPTVHSLLRESGAGFERHAVAVGRLDMATTGLLILTNDTRLSAWLTDPKNAVKRSYVATVRGEVSDATLARLREGVRDDGELLKASKAEVLKRSGRESRLALELVTGKNREIRRLCAALGHEVTRLKRVTFGGLALGDLEVGRWRELHGAELRAAFPGAPVRQSG